jgi:hypothetical protein
MPVTPFNEQPGDNGPLGLGDVEEKVMPFEHQPGGNGPEREMIESCLCPESKDCPFGHTKRAISRTMDPLGPHVFPGCKCTSF